MIENGSALLSFRTQNARSYRDEAEITFDALRIGNTEVVRELSSVASNPLRLLPVAGIYGANASGKTAFLRAMADMRETVLGSFATPRQRDSLRHPFLLRSSDEEVDSSPTSFTVELLIDGIRWQYGFSVTDDHILSEFAFNYPRGRPKLVFDRNAEIAKVGRQFRGVYKAIDALIHPGALMLSIIGALTRSQSQRSTDEANVRSLFDWFTENFVLLTASNRIPRPGLTTALVQNHTMRERVRRFLRAADLGITNLVTEKLDDNGSLEVRDSLATTTSRQLEEEVVKLEHRGETRSLLFDPSDESTGTQAWTGLAGPALQALDGGFVLLVDELDTSLHPHLVKRFVEIFQDPTLNPKCAQMVFNSHDTELLNDHDRFALGRDQIWFTEKSRNGETHIFPLSDFKGRREDIVGKRYLSGRYGGVPSLVYAPVDHDKGSV